MNHIGLGLLSSLLLITAIQVTTCMEYSHLFDTWEMKFSTPQDIKADVTWRPETDAGGSSSILLTDGQNLYLDVDFFLNKFEEGDSRDTTPENLKKLWKFNSLKTDKDPTISKLKNGDYVVAGPCESSAVSVMRTFDFDRDGQIDCYLVFMGGEPMQRFIAI